MMREQRKSKRMNAMAIVALMKFVICALEVMRKG
jgi:hypothetical protein